MSTHLLSETQSDRQDSSPRRGWKFGLLAICVVAVLVAALCCDAAAGITGEVFFVRRSEVAVFDPISTADQSVESESWTPETLSQALKTLPLHDLDEPY